MSLRDGGKLGLELGSLGGVVSQLGLEVGRLLLGSCQLAAQAALAPLQALHPLPAPPQPQSHLNPSHTPIKIYPSQTPLLVTPNPTTL